MFVEREVVTALHYLTTDTSHNSTTRGRRGDVGCTQHTRRPYIVFCKPGSPTVYCTSVSLKYLLHDVFLIRHTFSLSRGCR